MDLGLSLSWQRFINDYLADPSHWFVPKGRKIGAENANLFKKEISILLAKFQNRIWDSTAQEEFGREMERSRIYDPQIGHPSNYSFRAREEKTVLSVLGLAWVNNEHLMSVTPVGLSYAESNDLIEILSFQVIKWQFWNPSVRDWGDYFRKISLNPHLSLIKILQRVQGHSVSKDEFRLFLTKIRHDNQIEESQGQSLYKSSALKQVEAFRNLNTNLQNELINELHRAKGGRSIFRTIEQGSS